MSQSSQKQTRSRVEDLERAAWFARLAFGNPGEAEQPAPAPPTSSRSRFDVLP